MEQRTSLYFTDGKSDKEYHVTVTPKDGGFVVNFAYGRRGSALTTGTKTPTPVDEAKAIKIAEKLIDEKKGKGYTEAESGAAYQDFTGEKVVSGILPMLLKPIESDDVSRFINDDDYGAQIKYDGQRRLIRKDASGVVGINRKGFVVAITEKMADYFAQHYAQQFVLDGEIVGETLYVFDLLELSGQDLRGRSCRDRHALLLDVFKSEEQPQTVFLRIVTMFAGREDKRGLLARAMQSKEEGVVYKRLSAGYSSGETDDAFKFKFLESASVIVTDVTEGKRSVGMACYDANGALVSVGKVTIPPNHAVPAPQSVIECRYLYWFGPGGALFQPQYLGVREDLDPADCVQAKLKLKKSEELDEAA